MRRRKGAPVRGDEGGYSLVELIIVSVLVTGIVLVTTGASESISTAAKYGSRKLNVDAEAQSILHFIANDLQNASADTNPITLAPRYEVIPDGPVKELVSRTASDLADGDEAAVRTVTGAEELGRRPRMNRITENSRFLFRKVVGLDVDPNLDEVQAFWSSPIEYYLRDRRLHREHEGKIRVVGTNVTTFRVVAEPQGNFRIFLRVQRRNPSSGEVLSASGVIEVNPKNH